MLSFTDQIFWNTNNGKITKKMKFDPITKDIYTDKDEFVKRMNFAVVGVFKSLQGIQLNLSAHFVQTY